MRAELSKRSRTGVQGGGEVEWQSGGITIVAEPHAGSASPRKRSGGLGGKQSKKVAKGIADCCAKCCSAVEIKFQAK